MLFQEGHDPWISDIFHNVEVKALNNALFGLFDELMKDGMFGWSINGDWNIGMDGT